MFILVIDENDLRRGRLVKIIRDTWRMPVAEDPGLSHGFDAVRKHLAALRNQGAILWWPSRRVEEMLDFLGEDRTSVRLVQIEDPESSKRITKTCAALRISPTATEDEITSTLQDWLPTPPEPPEVPTLDELIRDDDPDSKRLQRLVKHLGPDGLEVIRQLVFQIFPEARGKVKLGWIGEGYSSSQLLKIEFTEAGGQRHRVLKLTPATGGQKCVDELKHYPRSTPEDVKKYGQLVPQIFWNQSGAGIRGGRPGPAQCGDWVGLAYDFVDDETQRFCDLAKAYFAQDDPCFKAIGDREQDPAEQVLELCLRGIRAEWYSKGKFKTRKLWVADRKPPKRGPWMPPYGFSAEEKRERAKALRKLERYKESVLGTFSGAIDRVYEVVWEGLSFRRKDLCDGIPVMLSQIHGDMNGGNLRCALDHQQGFFIDLACYRTLSHTLQDFARLEAEIKYMCMDSEPHDGNAHQDLAPDLFLHWCSIEDVLVHDDWRHGLRIASTHSPQVHRAIRLIEFIRREAWKTQDGRAKKLHRTDLGLDQFVPAYQAALLYETIHAITFDALPIVKRLLAVCSAAKLAEILVA